jgi:hypothetical protein
VAENLDDHRWFSGALREVFLVGEQSEAARVPMPPEEFLEADWERRAWLGRTFDFMGVPLLPEGGGQPG